MDLPLAILDFSYGPPLPGKSREHDWQSQALENVPQTTSKPCPSPYRDNKIARPYHSLIAPVSGKLFMIHAWDSSSQFLVVVVKTTLLKRTWPLKRKTVHLKLCKVCPLWPLIRGRQATSRYAGQLAKVSEHRQFIMSLECIIFFLNTFFPLSLFLSALDPPPMKLKDF